MYYISHYICMAQKIKLWEYYFDYKDTNLKHFVEPYLGKKIIGNPYNKLSWQTFRPLFSPYHHSLPGTIKKQSMLDAYMRYLK